MNYDSAESMSEEDPNTLDIEDDQADRSLLQLIESKNIAEDMDEDDLTKIGMDCKKGFEMDLQSRESWERDLDDWLALASQMRENKNFPWANASNVKYPLVATAAMQFAARSYPALIPGKNLVKAEIFGKDPNGEKMNKGLRVASYMDYQLLHEMDYWEEDMDRMLMSVSVMGMMFKKTYWDQVDGTIASKLVYPENFVVDYWTEKLDDAYRASEIIFLTKRDVEIRIRKGVFMDVELGDPQTSDSNPQSAVQQDDSTPYCFIEQHTFFDKDDDGLPEPYVVTFERKSGKVVRITARFSEEDVEVDDGEVVSIKPICYYTKYGFIPNPDGSFYDLGFGHLLGPLNESVNTNINQLLDAGTLGNLQAGFIGKGLRLKMGESKFSPGEWKVVNAMGQDLKAQILPLPYNPPSDVLFKLLGMLIQSGEKLASVAEIFTGKMPGQNTPATTTMATIEQGMKVFTAIYKRIYRALKKELKKMYRLNKIYLDDKQYMNVLEEQASVVKDFDDSSYDVCPVADPTASSLQEKMMKAQALMELLPLGTLDPIEVTIRVLQAQEQPNWEKLIPGMAQTGQPQIPQKQDPKMQEMQMKMELEQQKASMKGQELQQKMAMEQRSAETQLQMKQQEHQVNMASKLQQAQVDAKIAEHKQKIFMVEGQQKLMQNQAMGEQKINQAKEQAKLAKSQKTSSMTGRKTQSPKQSKKSSKGG